MPTRRAILAALAGPVAATAARAASLPDGFRGALDAAAFGIGPAERRDQSAAFRALLAEAVRRRLPVLLPPGDYVLADIALPDGLSLSGTPGATRLVPAHDGRFLFAEDSAGLTLTGLVLDGGTTRPGKDAQGLVDLRGVERLTIADCRILGGRGHGLFLERCGGRVRDNDISAAGGAGIFAVGSRSLSISGNVVTDCGNGGILVHRWESGEDGTVVSANRIVRIAARDGGTGENGNGINIFCADGVMVSDNHVSDCAFSAIRANAASDVLISGNQCLRSGETAIYSEFGFQGAIVTGNLIDGAANGILIVNFNEGGRLATVGQNIVRNLSETGPYRHDGAGFGFGIAVEADTVVTGNVIEGAPKWGLMLGWGPYLRNVVATGNLVRKAGAGCAVTVVEEAGSALVADNVFASVKAGIVGYRWNDAATGDLLEKDAPSFAHLTFSGNRVTA